MFSISKSILKRYAVFILSVMIQGISISVITYADIGTTPISSPNYVLSLHSSLTLGDTTLIFNILLVVLQILLVFLGEDKLKDHAVRLIMQLPICILFSIMIDLATKIMIFILPENIGYITSWLLVITGTFLLALAVALSVTASVAMISGEYFIKLFAPLVHKSFSYVKTCFDVVLVSSAVIISLFLTDFCAIEGVREGTVFAALSTGPIVHFMIPKLKWITKYF